MEFEVSYLGLENAQQFWDELEDILSVQSDSHELIDNALRSYLSFTTNFKGEYIQTEDDIARCSFRLLESALFAGNKEYVRRQIVYSLLQEDSPSTLHFIAAMLLFDGRQNDVTFEMMNEAGAFPRLLELILAKTDDDAGLHRTLLELLYEMSRIQRVRIQDLILVEDDFLVYMFEIIESLSDNVNDPYHYPVIRVILILNEQYMVSAHDPTPQSPSTIQLTNKVIKFLSTNGSSYKTFGENIILLLNRETETSLQLLILKLLYLVFTTPPTYEYFYTNDLHVLLDIILRNLLDLPPSAMALRHTYLRVLHPLLAFTPLKHPPHYKRNELIRLLAMMAEEGNNHFGAVDETTKRLVNRCGRVKWLKDEEIVPDPVSPVTSKRGLLSASIPNAMESSLSVVEVAAQKSKPGVKTPSRTKDGKKIAEERGEAEPDMGAVQTENKEPTDGNGAVSSDATINAVGSEKSPFEVEGET